MAILYICILFMQIDDARSYEPEFSHVTYNNAITNKQFLISLVYSDKTWARSRDLSPSREYIDIQA